MLFTRNGDLRPGAVKPAMLADLAAVIEEGVDEHQEYEGKLRAQLMQNGITFQTIYDGGFHILTPFQANTVIYQIGQEVPCRKDGHKTDRHTLKVIPFLDAVVESGQLLTDNPDPRYTFRNNALALAALQSVKNRAEQFSGVVNYAEVVRTIFQEYATFIGIGASQNGHSKSDNFGKVLLKMESYFKIQK